jgi:hypothetical protein
MRESGYRTREAAGAVSTGNEGERFGSPFIGAAV